MIEPGVAHLRADGRHHCLALVEGGSEPGWIEMRLGPTSRTTPQLGRPAQVPA